MMNFYTPTDASHPTFGTPEQIAAARITPPVDALGLLFDTGYWTGYKIGWETAWHAATGRDYSAE